LEQNLTPAGFWAPQLVQKTVAAGALGAAGAGASDVPQLAQNFAASGLRVLQLGQRT
jgi:hypothetical protein